MELIPCCTKANKYRLYPAEKKETNPSNNINEKDQATKLLINITSPIKFNEGGAAIFLERNINHHKDKEGIIESIPLFNNKLRLNNRS